MGNKVSSSYLSVALLLAAVLSAPAQDNRKLLAPTPPMGWNSWDAYGRSVTEADVRANAQSMAEHLKQFGWNYIVVDEGWYVLTQPPKPRTTSFHLMPTAGTFQRPIASLPQRMVRDSSRCLITYIRWD